MFLFSHRCFFDNYSEHLALSSEGGQATDALFSAASDADEQSVTVRHTKDSVQTRQVIQSVVEHHQVHGRLLLVVLLQNLQKHLYR